MKQSGCSRAGSPLATRRSGEGIQRLSYFGSNYNFPANFLSANTRAIANSAYHQNVVCCKISRKNLHTKNETSPEAKWTKAVASLTHDRVSWEENCGKAEEKSKKKGT